MDRPGGEIEALGVVDDLRQGIDPGGLERGVTVEFNRLETLHDIAEGGALGASGGQGLLAQLVLEVGLARGAHHDGLDLFVEIDGGDLVVGEQHVLVEQIADGEIIGKIADRHHGDDLLAVEIEGQGALDDHRGVQGVAFVIDACDPLGELRIGRIGLQQITVHGRNMARIPAAAKGSASKTADEPSMNVAFRRDSGRGG